MTQPLVLVAASGLAKEVIATVRAGGVYEVVAVLDDNPALLGSTLLGVPVTGGTDSVSEHAGSQLAICAGPGRARRAIRSRLAGFGVDDDRFPAIVHPSAVLGAGSTVGVGSILLAQVVLTADVRVGAHVVAMPNVVLTHDDTVDDFGTLCAGVVLGGGVHVETAAYLGMSSSVRQGLRVGAEATLGMGSVLLQDLPAGETWVGVPARPRPSAPSVTSPVPSVTAPSPASKEFVS